MLPKRSTEFSLRYAVPLAAAVVLAAAAVRAAETEPGAPAGPRTGEDAILAALAQKTSLEFIEQPLVDVVDFIKSEHQVEIQIDQRALDDVGVGTDVPITKIIRGVTLRSALELILRDLDLTWTIADEVLLITTPEEAEVRPLVRVYDVADLTTCRTPEGELWQDFDSLIRLLTTTIEPDSWTDVGGWGSLAELEFRGAKVLVVRQTVVVHQEIARLFDELRQVAGKSGEEDYPIRKPAPPAAPQAQGPGGAMGSVPGQAKMKDGFF